MSVGGAHPQNPPVHQFLDRLPHRRGRPSLDDLSRTEPTAEGRPCRLGSSPASSRACWAASRRASAVADVLLPDGQIRLADGDELRPVGSENLAERCSQGIG